MLFSIIGLGLEFGSGIIRNRLVSPDLTVRMRIAGAHHLSPILEDLNVVDPIDCAEFPVLVGPNTYDPRYVIKFHIGNCEIVTRGEADYSTDPLFCLGSNNPAGIDHTRDHVWHQGRIVIIENERAVVFRILVSAGAGIAGT